VARQYCGRLGKIENCQFRWVTCDTIFGNNPEFLQNLPEHVFYLAEIAKIRRKTIFLIVLIKKQK